ncbi:MAG: PLP-dependent aminotransferase family protein [Solirubrobacterales bacterium]
MTNRYSYARRVQRMRGSAIRELLKITERPEVISFAGGLPAPELFPAEDLKALFAAELSENGDSALQYSTTEGYLTLREQVCTIAAERGIPCTPDQVLITGGSQQALDLVGKIFIDAGAPVLVENPTYVGALQAFENYEAQFVPVPTDSDGISLTALESVLAAVKPAFLYVTPTFKNPTGITIPAEKRAALAALLKKHQLILVEDDPYSDIRFRGEPVPAVKHFDPSEQVIYLGSFSKSVAPGLRLGYAIAAPEIIQKLVLAKQGTDLHTGTLVQRVLSRYLASGTAKPHVETIREAYRERAAVMVDALRRHFPSEASWTDPEGGMFLWVTLPENVDTVELLPKASALNVAYVPGVPFFADGSGNNQMRLNFSNAAPEQIETGMARLGKLVCSVM